MDPPTVEDDRIGYVFAGWFDDADLTEEHDFTVDVLGPFTIYAGWEEATLYQLTSTHDTEESIYDFDKFTIQYSDGKVNAGDVLSFRYRSTTDFTFFSIRGDKKWVYENTSSTRGMTTYETKEDGWTYVTYVFAAKDTSGADIPADAWWRFDFGSRTIVIGDILEIQDWTLNGEPLEIAAANLTKYVQPTVEIIEGGSYAWDDVEVSFVTGEHAGAIDPVTVEFGSSIVAPDVKPADGYAFGGWYADDQMAKEYNFARPIIEDTVLYAKIGEGATLTFDVNGGSDIDPVTVIKGEKVAKPDDPEKSGFVFGGWFKEDTFDNEYDFADAVEADITIYAKWVSSKQLTLDLNYTGAPAAQVLDVEAGEAITEPKDPARAGFFFGGWYTEAACETPFSFEGGINADTTIYAKWEAPTKSYKYTAIESEKEGVPVTQYDRWQFRWKSTSVASLDPLAVGDVITFMVKFGTDGGGTAPVSCRIRTANDSSEKSLNLTDIALTPDESGWCYVTCAIPEGTEIKGKGLLFTIDGTVKVGDTCEIRAVAFNGEEIPFSTTSSSSGLYPGASATVEVIDLSN
jgi:uncharacterized repeat protein (TIGR02543 family)